MIKESKKNKSLNENYIDLHPVGAGDMFGGHSKALNEDDFNDEDYKDDEHMDRLHAVLDQEAFQRFVKSVTIIAEDLLQDGFEPEDIEDFLVKEIRSIIG